MTNDKMMIRFIEQAGFNVDYTDGVSDINLLVGNEENGAYIEKNESGPFFCSTMDEEETNEAEPKTIQGVIGWLKRLPENDRHGYDRGLK